MSRRALTLSVAGMVTLALLVAAVALPVPYVILGPGPTLNTLGRDGNGKPLIRISGHRVYPVTGHLNMVTVSYQGGPGDELNMYTALQAWLNPHEAVVPQQELFPPGQSGHQVQQANLQQMSDSQQTATAAALHQLGIGYRTVVTVAQTERGMPAATVLRSGDVIAAVDGTPVTSVSTLVTLIESHGAGGHVTLTIRRGRATRRVRVGTTRYHGRPVIGIEAQVAYRFPFPVTINVGQIGGPSAGLMFALGIIDKLTPMNLTDGRFIAGTGEIEADGTVEPIGGIQQKMVGARDKGATVFLTPAANCPDTKGAVPAGLRLIKVWTLAGAVRDLRALNAGKPVPSC